MYPSSSIRAVLVVCFFEHHLGDAVASEDMEVCSLVGAVVVVSSAGVRPSPIRGVD